MRTIKDANERKNEILDVAESLFISKGYDNTTISDILNVMGVARGTLYYHYKSKEEVLDGIIIRRSTAGVIAAEAIADNNTLSALEKMLKIMLAQKPANKQQQQLVTALENVGNAQMFQKSLIEIILRLAPILGKVIEQGNKEGVFNTPYTQDSAEILLAAAHTLFDSVQFHRSPEEMQQKIVIFLFTAERILGASEGSLLQLTQLL